MTSNTEGKEAKFSALKSFWTDKSISKDNDVKTPIKYDKYERQKSGDHKAEGHSGESALRVRSTGVSNFKTKDEDKNSADEHPTKNFGSPAPSVEVTVKEGGLGQSNNSVDKGTKQGKKKEIHEIQDDTDFKTQLQKAGGKLVVVDFYATWCGPCKMMAPKFDKMSLDYENVIFLKVDVDECQEITANCGVTSMPTFIFYKNGQRVGEMLGTNEVKLRELIESL